MKVRLPYLVQDPSAAVARPVEKVSLDGEDIFLDGPVTRRVAVLDFSADGSLAPPSRFLAEDGTYEVADLQDLTARDFNRVSVLATVLKTMQLFEEDDVLGRRLTWAFDSPQLLVVPRAGEKPNARYLREARCLEFFHFASRRPEHRGRTIYTSLSQDVIAHETAHAIVDGIAPDLYHALSPQAGALHEALADLVAFLVTVRSRALRGQVLKANQGSIRDARTFSWVAEEFGAGRDRSGQVGYLRSLDNDKTLDPSDRSRDPRGERNFIRSASPHALSQVLSGAFYRLMLDIYDRVWQREQERTGRSPLSTSGRALFIATERFKRILLRGLDYLPPGEIDFTDFARAVLASDAASHPGDGVERKFLSTELLRREAVIDRRSLNVEVEPRRLEVEPATLLASDWAAYDFVERHRDLLGVPAGKAFNVRPRLAVERRYFREGGERPLVRELLLKVSWHLTESNGGMPRVPAERQFTAGSCLSLDWQTGTIRALLRSTAAEGDGEDERQRGLTQLAEDGALDPGAGAAGPWIERSGDLMRVRGVTRRLHAVADEAGESRPVAAEAKPPSGVDAGVFTDLVRWRVEKLLPGQDPR